MIARLSARLAGALCATAMVASAPAQAQFGGLSGLIDRAKTAKKVGDSLRAIHEPEEIKLGGDLAAMLLGAAPLVDNAAEQHYVNRVGRWLALHTERPDLPWKFGVIATPDINAFSTPGGYVLISQGLFDRLRNESELAGVLAHEIAHVVQKHHLKALQSSLRSAAMSDMNAYFNGGGGLTSQFTRVLLESGKEMFIRGLDKDDEFEADRMGVVIAARSGYSPYGLVGVLQTLAAAPQDHSVALIYKTHPLPADRLDRLDSAMGTQFDGVQGLVDDLPSFVALRAPPPPMPAPKGVPARRGKRRG
jgi:predicted Zn-dependent protease